MHKVRCAVIGAGWWGTTAHIPALLAHPDAELVAVQHRDPETAAKIAADFGIPRASSTAEEVLAIDDLDAVVISSTPNVHYAQAKAALAHGLHVLIEKPMTITAREAMELVDLARDGGLQFLISAPWHYTPHCLEAQRLIRDGALGRVKMIGILMTNFTLGLYRGMPWDEAVGGRETVDTAARPYLVPGRDSYSDAGIAGGGQIYCQVSHPAAYLSYLTGRQPAEVFARFDNGDTAVDIYDTLNLKLDDGTLVSVASTGATMMSERNYEVRAYGTAGMIFQELWKGRMEFHDRDGDVRKYPDIPEAETYPMFQPAVNLVDCVLGRAPNLSPADHGLFAMRVIEAACQSARTNENVVVQNS